MKILDITTKRDFVTSVDELRPDCIVSIDLPFEDKSNTYFRFYGSKLRMKFDDISAHHGGLGLADVPPSTKHIKKLINFARRNKRKSVVLHCAAGESRSAAAAIILAVTRHPWIEEWILMKLFIKFPLIDPNMRMIRFADRLLNRKGKLIKRVKLYREHHKSHQYG